MVRKDSVVKILGSTHHSKEQRDELDFYATDPKSLSLFLDKIAGDKLNLSHNIWEVACGDGAISKVLKRYGYEVYCTDIVDRKKTQQDVMDFTNPISVSWCGDILTNPPYKHAMDFVKNSLSLVENGRYVIMFLRLQFLEGKKRGELFKKFPPKFIYVHTRRQMTYKNNNEEERKKTSAICFAWFVWQKGSQTEPIIRWI